MSIDREFNPIVGAVMAMGLGYGYAAGSDLHNLVLYNNGHRWRYTIAKAGFRLESDTHARVVFCVHFGPSVPARGRVAHPQQWNDLDSDQVVQLILDRQAALESAYEPPGT